MIRRDRLIMLSLVGSYLLVVCLLGVRPFFPAFHRLLRGSNLGAYNMFSAVVERRERARLVGPEKQSIGIDHQAYLWMNPFINTTHSHVELDTLQRFAAFLAQRPEIRQRVPSGQTDLWQVEFQLDYRKNDGPWIRLVARQGL